MLKGVIFDLDGVITDTAKFHFKAWKSIAENLDIGIDEKFNESLKGITRTESLKKILKYGNKADEYSEDEIIRLSDKKNMEYKKYLELLTKEDILPGIEKLMIQLKERNIKIAVASVSQNAPYILEKLDLMRYIDFIADPMKVKRGKPEPDIFIEAARGISLNIEDVVGIEDSEAGVESMKKCKMKSIGIGVKADLKLKDTSQLSFEKISNMF